MMDERLKGVAEAIRIIKAMDHDWPDAIGLPPTDRYRYGDQFVRRILEVFPEAEKFVPLRPRAAQDKGRRVPHHGSGP